MNKSGSIVADITTSRKSRRRSATSFSSPSSMSVATCRSCTSSMITSEYRSSLGSTSRQALQRVRLQLLQQHALRHELQLAAAAAALEADLVADLRSSSLPAPTSPVSSQYISFATRSLREIVDRRRGCVHTMWLQPAPIRYCGTCVLFPQPVSPMMIVTGFFLTESMIASFSLKMGSDCLSRFISIDRKTETYLVDRRRLLDRLVVHKHVETEAKTLQKLKAQSRVLGSEGIHQRQ